MKVILGADHAATALKESLKGALQKRGYEVADVSPSVPQAGDDYPAYAFAVAEHVAAHPETRGILLCDTGVGMSIAANKVPGVYAALARDERGARRAREHNGANILALGAEGAAADEAERAAVAFLTTPFSREERHARRVQMIAGRERGVRGRPPEGTAER